MIAASLLLEKLQIDDEVDVFQAVQRARFPRPEMVTSLVSHKFTNKTYVLVVIIWYQVSMLSRHLSIIHISIYIQGPREYMLQHAQIHCVDAVWV